MNKEEAKQKLHNLAFPKLDTIPEKLNISDVLRIVDEIDDPQKPKVPLGVLLVDMPEYSAWEYVYLYRHTHGVHNLNFTDDHNVVLSSKRAIKITEAEAKEKYPNFKWVSLEELEK